MVEAEHRGAIEGHILDKLDEGVLDCVEAAIMVEMFGIDVGDDRDRAIEAKEAAVALVGFDHHPVAGAEARVRSVIVDDAAVDHGRVRSEEHTSELQSLMRISYAVFCLKKKNTMLVERL